MYLEPLFQYLKDNEKEGTTVRVSFAQALLHNPPNLILDEPVTGLDHGLYAGSLVLKLFTESFNVRIHRTLVPVVIISPAMDQQRFPA